MGIVMNKKIIMAALAAVFVLLPALRCFAKGANDPSLVVVSTADGASRAISIDWSAVSKPEQYKWGLYRYDLEEKTYTLIEELESYTSSYIDEYPDPPLTRYYYKLERADKNASLEAMTPKRLDKNDVQKQLASVYESGASASPAFPSAGSSVPARTASLKTTGGAGASFFNEGIYIGIISFSGQVKDITQNPDGSPALVLLDGTGRQALIENLNHDYQPSKSNGTALYYADHKTLANLAEMKSKNSLPSNVDSVTVITFTDGTDTSSTDADFKPLEGQGGFNSAARYRSFIKQQFSGNAIGRIIPGVKKFSAWAIGISGKDIQNEAEFTETLRSVASAPEYAEEVYEFPQVNAKLSDIADELLHLYRPRINLTISTPAYPVGTLVRITFDDYASPDISEHCVDLRVSWDGAEKTYALNPVDARGTEIADGSRRIYGKRNETGIDYTMMLSADFNESNVRQWYMQPGEDAFGWMQNREFAAKKSADFTHERKSEIIYLVLDSSSSLAEKEITEIRQAVTLFINKLYNSLYGAHSGEVMIVVSNESGYPQAERQTGMTVLAAPAQEYRQGEEGFPSGARVSQTREQAPPPVLSYVEAKPLSTTPAATAYQSYQKPPAVIVQNSQRVPESSQKPPAVIVQNSQLAQESSQKPPAVIVQSSQLVPESSQRPPAVIVQSSQLVPESSQRPPAVIVQSSRLVPESSVQNPPVPASPVQVWQRTNTEFQFPPLELYQRPSIQAAPQRSPESGIPTGSVKSERQRIVVETLTTKTSSAAQNRYWVQIGSYSDAAYAQRSWRTFSNTGMGSAEIFTTNVNGVTHYRVKAGPYIDKTEAESALVRLKNYSPDYKDSFVTSE
jgi:cell division protein FtsN